MSKSEQENGGNGRAGARQWKSLEEFRNPPEPEQYLEREFPESAIPSPEDADAGRRGFLKLMGASMALAGLASCSPPQQGYLLPYVEEQERITPGKSLFYATTLRHGGYGRGVLVESREGRPIKIEGNPDHPASLGATDMFAQASLLDLYDTDRSETVRYRGQTTTWEHFERALSGRLPGGRAGGSGFRVLLPHVTSPTLEAQLAALLERYPQAKIHVYDPAAPSTASGAAVTAASTAPRTAPASASATGPTAQETPAANAQHPVYHFDQADVILSLDTNFLAGLPGSTRYAHDFAALRRVRKDKTQMNRLYALESSPTIMGTMADHRLTRPPHVLETLARGIAHHLGAGTGSGTDGAPGTGNGTGTDGGAGGVLDAPAIDDRELDEWVRTAARDLQEKGPRAVVVAGPAQPHAMQALARAMNEALGSIGTSVEYGPSHLATAPFATAGLAPLVRDMLDGGVETLLMIGGNPVYNAPQDIPFAEGLAQVDMSIHLSRMVDETSSQSIWHLPRTHELEAWSDARAFDGTPSLVQPLIAPLYNGRSMHEVLSTFTGEPRTGYDIIRQFWAGGNYNAAPAAAAGAAIEQDTSAGVEADTTGQPEATESAPSGFQTFWQNALRTGVIPAAALPPTSYQLPAAPATNGAPPSTTITGPPSTENQQPPTSAPAQSTLSSEIAADGTTGEQTDTAGLTLLLRPDPTLHYGEYANNGWLQELPKPLTKLTWGNAAIVSIRTADQYDLEDEDVVELTYREHTLTAPVWVMAGHPHDCVTLYLGNGRTHAGIFDETHESRNWGYSPAQRDAEWSDETVGFDAYHFRFSDAPLGGRGLHMRKTGEQLELASAQHHHSMEGRALVEEAPIEKFREDPNFLHEDEPIHLPSLLPEYEYPDYKWGMVIDLNTCIGCSACVVACQAENNIPVVGKDQVRMGREMHWLRIDRYYKGPPDEPDTFFQPVPCMHCEKAPCELVCPVNATVHDSEGLNVMIYNRCIGTRYCSNNCPYKVRRFNFLLYADWYTESKKAMRNPEVTTRSRGVMEKCTYCQQRISTARIRAKRDDRRIRDGEMMTACQQACPTNAIHFGDLNDKTAEVHHLEKAPQNYALLEELGTRPRTTYLAKFYSENEEMPKPVEAEEEIGQTEKIEVEVGQPYK